MVVHDLYVLRAGGRPAEAHAKLVVHADTVLPSAVAPERLQSVAWRYAEVINPACDLQLPQLPSRYRLDVRPPPDPPAFGQGFRVGAFERLDHEAIVTLGVLNVKRDAPVTCRRRPVQSPSEVAAQSCVLCYWVVKELGMSGV
jgi:hypothetical protein